MVAAEYPGERGSKSLNLARRRDPESGRRCRFWLAGERYEKAPRAQRNLAACLAKAGRTEEAEKHLRQATILAPDDQQAMFGLAEALSILGRHKEADEAYQKIIDINEFGKLADVARETRRKAAEETFKERAGGALRPDAVMYCLSAIEKFEKMSEEEVKRIGFEIVMKGRGGLDTTTRRHSAFCLEYSC